MSPRTSDFACGDILGFSSHSLDGVLINIGTYGLPFWSLSHVAIVGEYAGRKLLFESNVIPEQKCVVQNAYVCGTQAVEIEHKIETYKGKVWHFPLYRTLYDFEHARLDAFLIEYLGRNYDDSGAVDAAGKVASWLKGIRREASLNTLFCSEYCCAAHTAIGLFQTANVSRWSPNSFVREERGLGLLRKPRRLK